MLLKYDFKKKEKENEGIMGKEYVMRINKRFNNAHQRVIQKHPITQVPNHKHTIIDNFQKHLCDANMSRDNMDAST